MSEAAAYVRVSSKAQDHATQRAPSNALQPLGATAS